MKRVAINAVVLHDQSGGLGQYINKLIQYFNDQKCDFEPVIYLSKSYYESSKEYKKYLNIRTLDLSPYNPIKRIFREPFVWKKVLRRDNIDLFFSPISYIPAGINVPSLITIHDLGFFHFPRNYTFLRVNYLQLMIKNSARRARRIFTISEFSRQDIIKTLGIPAEKIDVIYEGVGLEFFTQKYSLPEQERIRQQYGLPEKYILSVGHLEPRKNFIRLIHAFHRLKTQFGIQHSLIIAGKENWYFKDIYRQVKEYNLENSVIFTNFVKADDLPALYAMADIFVSASTFEGFGFTPLESMAAGTPVAVANSTSLPEITGKAAVLFDPFNVDDMAEKIYNLLVDIALQEELVARGYKNLHRFDWQQCCRQTANKILRETEKL